MGDLGDSIEAGTGASGMAQAPEGKRVYAIGDIHGRADLLGGLLDDIAADFRDRPAGRGVIVFLGDYVDRGPDSSQVIEILLAGAPAGMEAVYLKGNHEDFLLTFVDAGAFGETWLMNGAGATLVSYGVAAAGDTFHALWHLDEIRDAFIAALPAAHLDFLHRLRLWHREGGYLFVHAGLRPGVPLAAQTDEDLMWIREDFLRSEADFGCIVVHGHSARLEPVVRRNRIGIDTMAYRSDRLTALVLEGTSRRFIATRP